MRWIKVLGSGLLATIMLVAVGSCGVPSPTTTTATVVPANTSTISRSDSIVIAFSGSMTPGSLILSGDMVNESDRGVWSRASVTNDTLTISPNAAGGGLWTVGSRTLIVDVEGINELPIATLTLNYTVGEVPTATISSSGSGPILASDIAVIVFSVAMDPSTLVLTGDMVVESDGGKWLTTTNTNDTLVISPLTAWTGTTDTLIVNVKSAEGVSMPTITLTYTIDTTVPVATALPADTAAINDIVPIVISFTKAMEPTTLVLGGTLAIESDGGIWSSGSSTNDTLTISPLGAWTGGPHTLIIDVDALNTQPLDTLTLNYTVDVALSVASVTPGTNNIIAGGDSIVIDFNESMDIATLVATGTLWANSDNGVWSTTTNTNDKLTISPAVSASVWPAGTIDLTLDIADLVGSLAPLNLSYTVDLNAPVITLLGTDPTNIVLGSTYDDAGATALDNIDGDITGNIIVGGDVVDVNTEGVYIITYNVSDTAGNPAAQVTRTVNVVAPPP